VGKGEGEGEGVGAGVGAGARDGAVRPSGASALALAHAHAFPFRFPRPHALDQLRISSVRLLAEGVQRRGELGEPEVEIFGVAGGGVGRQREVGRVPEGRVGG
jgi:hypothetical protein